MLARTIWKWCIQKQIWLSATYLPGVLNVEADKQSKLHHDNTTQSTGVPDAGASMWCP